MKWTLRVLSILLSLVAAALVARTLAPGLASAGGVRFVEARESIVEVLAERAADPVDPEAALAAREPLPLDIAARLYPSVGRELDSERPRKLYDPQAIFVNAPGWSGRMRWDEHPRRTWTLGYNQAGFRDAEELSEEQPEVRVLLTGDSHIEGVLPEDETVTALLERRLREERGTTSVEVLNAGSGGYDFYNYLGVLEKFLPLRPDVFVVVVYGGNDFHGVLPVHAYHRRIQLDLPGDDLRDRVAQLVPEHSQVMAQGLNAVALFNMRPGLKELAVEAGVSVLREIRRLCRENDIELLVAYLPAQHDVHPERMREPLARFLEVFELPPPALRVTNECGDGFLDALDAAGIEAIDLRPVMRATGAKLYWRKDYHLNHLGHQLLARQLLPRLRELVPRPVEGPRAED